MTDKDAFQLKMQHKLDELSAEIDKMKSKANQEDTGTRNEYYKQINYLLGRRGLQKTGWTN